MQYGLDGAEKYMALAFECGIAMKKNLNTQSVLWQNELRSNRVAGWMTSILT